MQKLREFIEYFRVDERLGWVSYTEHAQRQTERLRLVDDHKKGADAKKEDFDIVKASFAPRSGSSTPESGGNGSSIGNGRGNGSDGISGRGSNGRREEPSQSLASDFGSGRSSGSPGATVPSSVQAESLEEKQAESPSVASASARVTSDTAAVVMTTIPPTHTDAVKDLNEYTAKTDMFILNKIPDRERVTGFDPKVWDEHNTAYGKNFNEFHNFIPISAVNFPEDAFEFEKAEHFKYFHDENWHTTAVSDALSRDGFLDQVLTVEQCVNHIYSAQEMEKRREGTSGLLDIGRVFSGINELIQHSAGRDLLRISCGKDCEIVLGETLFNDREQLRTIRDSGVWTPETLSEMLGPLNEAVAASQRGEHVERPLLDWEFYLSGKIFIKSQSPHELAEATAEEGQNPQPQNSLKKIEGQQVFRMAEFRAPDVLAQSQRVATREHMEEKWREYACATAADPSDSKKLSNCRLMLGTFLTKIS